MSGFAALRENAPGTSLDDIQERLTAVAGGLDERFVRAGTALATAYDIVEKLVASLDGVTSALDREAADAAIENMRAMADRLARIPALQEQRRGELTKIREASEGLRGQIAQIRRTLEFLRICGLNIRIAAAGADGFATFADGMFARLDHAEAQLGGFEGDILKLAEYVGSMSAAEQVLAAECAKVIPQVPAKLAADAGLLQQHQLRLAQLAMEIAEVARDIRGKVATAIGALQIGDITRQRLEHVASGLVTLAGFLDEQEDIAEATRHIVEAHVIALLAAQTSATIEDFRREAQLLGESLRGITPDTHRLLSLRQSEDAGQGSDEQFFLQQLEQGISEVESVTRRLNDADAHSDQLGNLTSQTAENLAKRLKAVRLVQSDVEHMAWNTGLRCRDLGQDGLALAVVASEIRNFANTLDRVWNQVSRTFEQLAAAAGAIRTGEAQNGDVEGEQTLTASLGSIRGAGMRMRESMLNLDADAAVVIDILRDSTSNVDCESEIGTELAEVNDALAAYGCSEDEIPEDALAPIGAILATIARSYTMASERQIHARFALTGEEAAASDEEDDDGLFDCGPASQASLNDDALFDDALF